MSEKVYVYNREDFYSADDSAFVQLLDDVPRGLEYESKVESLRENAKAMKISNKAFDRLLKAYETQRKSKSASGSDSIDKYSLAGWRMLESGNVIEPHESGPVEACSHPLYVSAERRNIDTDDLSVEIKFSHDNGKTWKEADAPVRTISSDKKIIELADKGISVSSINAKPMVKYLQNFRDANRGALPIQKTLTRFGWFDGTNHFAPYDSGDVIFVPSDTGSAKLRDAMEQTGDFDLWVDTVRKIRAQRNPGITIPLAASFASVLCEPVRAQPAIVHLWSASSGNGKTVALKLCASVWGNPNELTKTFNATENSLVSLFETMCNIPVFIDELQTKTDRDARSLEKTVMILCEGTGRGRLNRNAERRKERHWRNIGITTGNQPIVASTAGAHAHNRVIEIQADGMLFDDPIEVNDIVEENYGIAGGVFVGLLQDEETLSRIRKNRDQIQRYLVQCGYTGKQAMAASIIMAAEQEIAYTIFDDREAFTIDDLAKYIEKDQDIDTGATAYNWLLSWIAQNDNKFVEEHCDKPPTETYGRKYDNGRVAIICSVLTTACEKAGMSDAVLKGYLFKNGLIESTDKGRKDKTVFINGTCVKCIVLKGGPQ